MMTATAPRPDQATRTAGDYQALIQSAFFELNELLPLVVKLVDSHQRGMGFLTVEGRKVMDDLVRSERRDYIRVTTRAKADQRQWLSPTVRGSGQVPAPVGIAAASLLAEVNDYLVDLCHRLTTRLNRSGVCYIGGWVGAEVEPITRAQAMVTLLASPTRLQPIHSTLEDLVARARRLVDGVDARVHPEPCPHCGRHTLVIHTAGPSSTWFIECEKDPHTGRYETCLCSDSYCECKTNHGYRHQWKYSTKRHKATSWDGLKRAQKYAATDNESEPTP